MVQMSFRRPYINMCQTIWLRRKEAKLAVGKRKADGRPIIQWSCRMCSLRPWCCTSPIRIIVPYFIFWRHSQPSGLFSELVTKGVRIAMLRCDSNAPGHVSETLDMQSVEELLPLLIDANECCTARHLRLVITDVKLLACALNGRRKACIHLIVSHVPGGCSCYSWKLLWTGLWNISVEVPLLLSRLYPLQRWWCLGVLAAPRRGVEGAPGTWVEASTAGYLTAAAWQRSCRYSPSEELFLSGMRPNRLGPPVNARCGLAFVPERATELWTFINGVCSIECFFNVGLILPAALQPPIDYIERKYMNDV